MSDEDPKVPGQPSDSPQGEPERPAEPATPIDWESFYANYRKPGYIEGFEITSKLGGGMFGLVFKATRQSIGKDYAIKFLKVDDHEVRRAVLNELDSVRYFAQVDHPNLVSIEDRGVVDGIPFIVMAYAGSETLRHRIDQAPSPQIASPGQPAGDERRELLHLFLQACRGVHALHERSLVHFDLKPANIFIKGDVARVGDYGLSKLVSASRNSLSMGRGTPYYMAPEMLQRRGDHRSDIYSLGVILFECLTGEVPFKGDSEWEVLKAHETKDPEFPDYVAHGHRHVVLRCMAKDPESRYENVAEIIEAMQAPTSAADAALADLGVGRRPTPPPVPPETGGGRPNPPPLPGKSSLSDSTHSPRRVVVPPPIPEAYRRVDAKAVVASISGQGRVEIARLAKENARKVAARRKKHRGRRRHRLASVAAWAPSARRGKLQGKDAGKGDSGEAKLSQDWDRGLNDKMTDGGRAESPRSKTSSGGSRLLLGLLIAGVIFFSLVGVATLGFGATQVRWQDSPSPSFNAVDRVAFASAEATAEDVVRELARLDLPAWEFLDGQSLPSARGLQARLPDDLINNEPTIRFPANVGRNDRRNLREKLQDLVCRENFDLAYGRGIQDEGYAGLVAAVDYLQHLEMDDKDEVAQAKRIVEFLSDWTGIRDIEIRTPDGRRVEPVDVTYNLKGVRAWAELLSQPELSNEAAFRVLLSRSRGR